MLRLPRNKLTGLRLPSHREEEETIFEARLNGGLVTSLDAADIEPRQLTDAKNARVRFDKTSRRPGSSALTPAKPDSNKILLVSPWERFNGDVEIIRFTPSSIHRRLTLSWSAIVGVLTGGADDRFNITIANDRFFFANGVDDIQEIDLTGGTHAQLGNAPPYKYIIAFNNRIVGANLYDAISPSPITIGWSGNLNFDEWDNSVDPSAGSVPLVDSTTDFSDDITGLFSFTETALILRQRSLWGINKVPVSSDPFQFFPISTAVGCDAPHSAVSVANGIAWYDLRTKSVWHYKIGMPEPERIGLPVEDAIADQINNIETLFATYDTLQDEYTVGIPNNTTDVVSLWTYNFKTKAWVYDEQLLVSAVASVDFSSAALVIDELIGFIDDLAGFIDDLGYSVTRATRFYGRTNGDINVENELTDTDNGATYTTVIASKVFKVPRKQGYIQKLAIEYIPKLAGDFGVYYSKDGGLTWKLYKTVTFDNAMINARKKVTCYKHLSVNEYMWKIEGDSGIYDIVEFDIAAIASTAEQRSR